MTRTTTFIFLYVLLALTAAIVLAVPRPQAPGVQDPTGGKAGAPPANGNAPAAAPPAEAPEAGNGEQPPATDQQQPPPAAPPSEGGDPNADPNATPPEQAPPPATPEQAPDAGNGAEQPPPPAQDPAQEPQQPPAEAPPTGEQPPPTGEQPPPTDPVNPDPAQEPPAEEPVEEPTQDDINEQETPEQVESEPEETANGANGGNGGNGGGGGGGQTVSDNVAPKDPSACSSDDECASGESCQDGTCAATEEAPASDDDQGDNKVGKKVGISVGVICGIVGAGGLAFWVFRYMHHKRETDQYARNSIASFSSGGLAATPGLDNNASTLMVERRASKPVYPFSSPQAGFGNSDVQQSRYRLSLNYGGAGGVGASSTAREYNDEGYTYDHGNGYAPGPQYAEPATAPLMTLTPPPPVRAPEAPKTDRAVRPAANLAQSAQPVEPFEPAQFASSDNLPNSDSGSVHVVYTVANPEQAAQKQKELAAAAKTLTPTANSGMLRRNDSKRSNVRDSTTSTGSSNVATNSVYLGIDKFLNTEDGYDDQDDDALSPNGNTGRYRMNSMYSTYSRDSSIFGQEGAPPLPSPLKSSFTNMPAGSSSQPSPPMLSKPALTTIGETPAGSSEGVSVSEVPRSSVFTLHAPIFKAYQASSEEEVPPLPTMPNSRY